MNGTQADRCINVYELIEFATQDPEFKLCMFISVNVVSLLRLRVEKCTPADSLSHATLD